MGVTQSKLEVIEREDEIFLLRGSYEARLVKGLMSYELINPPFVDSEEETFKKLIYHLATELSIPDQTTIKVTITPHFHSGDSEKIDKLIGSHYTMEDRAIIIGEEEAKRIVAETNAIDRLKKYIAIGMDWYIEGESVISTIGDILKPQGMV
jgi:hypothetical protein